MIDSAIYKMCWFGLSAWVVSYFRLTSILSDQVPENVSDFLPISGMIFTRQTECIQNEGIIHSLVTFPF